MHPIYPRRTKLPLKPVKKGNYLSTLRTESSQNIHSAPLTYLATKVTEMLSKAFTKPKRNPRYEDCSNWSGTILEYDEESLVGFVDDLPLSFCGENESQLSLREVLRASVGVMGESRLGMTEKVVLLEGKVYAVKRFRIVSVGRREFKRRVERFAQVSQKCRNLVPLTAYIYAKRIKFVLGDYYPMGSLADLLTGGRENGHTALDWNQRHMIALFTARAIAFIHAQYPPYEKRMQMNVHGNIKASNIMVNVDFTACLSDYGFIQLADLEEAPDRWQKKRPHPPNCSYSNKISQACDMYNFGLVLLDMLGGPGAPGFTGCITQTKEQTKGGGLDFFEFVAEGKERKQALQVLEIALACTKELPEARPSIEEVLRFLEDGITE